MYTPFSKQLRCLFVGFIALGLLGTAPALGKKSVQPARQQEAQDEQDDNLDFLDDTDTDKTPAAQGKEPDTAQAEECFELYSTLTRSADAITSDIQHLCQVTTQGRIVEIGRMESVIEWLNSVQQKNSEIKRSPTMPLNKKNLYSCLRAQDRIVTLLREGIQNGFRHLPDVAEIVDQVLETRSGSVSTDKVQAQAALVKKNLRTLTRSIEECGLTSFNKFYGRVVSPLLPWALIGCAGLAAAGGGYYLYQNVGTEKAQGILSRGWDNFLEHVVGDGLRLAAYGMLPLMWVWTAKNYSAMDSYLRGNKFKPTNNQTIVDDLDLDDPCFDHLRGKLAPIYHMIDYIQNPKKYSLAGIKNFKAVLLVGAPGTGKSELARGIAGQLQKVIGHSVMISVNFDHYIEKGGIKKIFEDAKNQSSSVVLFFDEVHLYGVQNGTNPVGLQEFLACLDEINRETDERQKVFVIGATNRPDLLEDPLKRQGRFGTIIELTKPDFDDRVNILTMLCKKSAINPEDVQIQRIARLTNDRPMSDIASMFSQACFLAKSENKPVSFEHMYRALNTKLRNITEVLVLKPAEVAVVSAHIAGRAIALLNLKTTAQLDMITLYAEQKKIIARYDWQAKLKNDEGQFFKPDPGLVYAYEENELISGIGQTDRSAPVKILLAGLVAQRVLCGAETSYHRAEREQALEMAIKILAGGIDLKKLARKERDTLLAQASELVKTAEAEIEKLLIENKPALECLAKALAERKILRVEEIREIIAQK